MDRLNLLLKYLKEDPDDGFTRFAVAMEYLKSGEITRACETLEQLVEQQPDYVGAYYHLASVYRQLGREDDAVDTYRAGIREAQKQKDHHALSELQSALLEAEGIGFDDE